MAVGDLVTTDWMVEFNGDVVGDNEAASLVAIDGLSDLPAIRSADRTVLRRHGLHAGDDFMGGKDIPLPVEVEAATDAELATEIASLSAAFSPGDERPMVLQVPGVAGGGKRIVYARPRGMSAPINLAWLYGLPVLLIRMAASDPSIYAFTESTESDTLPSTEGGREFNETPDITFGAVSTGGLFDCTNDGTFETWPVIKLTGPVASPGVTNVTTGGELELSLTVADGDYVLLDTSARTVLLNGTASRYSSLTAASTWWALSPGDNEIRYEASTTTTSTITLTWRSAWLS